MPAVKFALVQLPAGVAANRHRGFPAASASKYQYRVFAVHNRAALRIIEWRTLNSLEKVVMSFHHAFSLLAVALFNTAQAMLLQPL